MVLRNAMHSNESLIRKQRLKNPDLCTLKRAPATSLHLIKDQVYPYHNKIKQRIKNHELERYEYVDKYKTISPCLLLYFTTEPKIKPIREHRFKEYEAILSKIS
jgi:hypothetical protein